MNRSQKIFKLVEESDLVALVYTEEVSTSANRTFVKFNKVPPKEIAQAAINMTDGDYDLTGKDLVLNHRTITGKQRTINIAKALKRAGVRVDEIKYHGEDVTDLGEPWPSEQGSGYQRIGPVFPPTKIEDDKKKLHLGDKVIVDVKKLDDQSPGYINAVQRIIRLSYGKPTVIAYQITGNEVKISPSWEEKDGIFVSINAVKGN